MSNWVADNVRLTHVTIAPGRFRNFSGARTDWNKTGAHKFTIFLPVELGENLKEIGWNTKLMDPYREGDDPKYKLEIEASWDSKGGRFAPPVIKLYSWDGTETMLNEETVGLLDSTDIADAELEIRPHNWKSDDGKSGCKAYLQELLVTTRKPRMALDARMRRDDEDEEDEF